MSKLTALEIEDIVEQLNSEVFDVCSNDPYYGFSFRTCGSVRSVEFGGILLWDDQDCDREYTETEDGEYHYEPLMHFLVRKFNTLLTNMITIKHQIEQQPWSSK